MGNRVWSCRFLCVLSKFLVFLLMIEGLFVLICLGCILDFMCLCVFVCFRLSLLYNAVCRSVIVAFPVHTTVVPTKSDSDAIFCLQLSSKTLTCTLNLS